LEVPQIPALISKKARPERAKMAKLRERRLVAEAKAQARPKSETERRCTAVEVYSMI
jgi:hypothetical protein